MWLQFNAVRRRSGKTVSRATVQLEPIGTTRPELLMRLGSRAATKGRSLSQFSHGLTGRYRTDRTVPD